MPRSKRHQIAPPPSSYWIFSQQPLQVLFFLSPLLLVYELGVFMFIGSNAQALVAEVWINKFFELFGVSSLHLPPLAIVVVLLCRHVFRRDAVEFDARTYLVMLAESVLWSTPLLVFGLVLSPRHVSAQAILELADFNWRADLVQSIGAGIYEEFIFRLVAIALIHALMVDLLALPEKWGALGAITISSIAFALVHFISKDFQFSLFLYYTLTGVYFASVYLLRGFGIVVGAHAMYDVFVLIMKVKAGV